MDAVDLAVVRHLCRTGEARRLRVASQVSLAEAAATIGTSATVVSRWERGLSTPRRRVLCERYGALLAELWAVEP